MGNYLLISIDDAIQLGRKCREMGCTIRRIKKGFWQIIQPLDEFSFSLTLASVIIDPFRVIPKGEMIQYTRKPIDYFRQRRPIDLSNERGFHNNWNSDIWKGVQLK